MYDRNGRAKATGRDRMISAFGERFGSFKERDQYQRAKAEEREQGRAILANPDFVPTGKAFLMRWAEDIKAGLDPKKDEKWVELGARLSKINGSYPDPCGLFFRDRTLRPLAQDLVDVGISPGAARAPGPDGQQ